MPRLTRIAPLLLFLICALFAAEARADTFVITGGSATVDSGGGTFTFNGSGMSVSGNLTNGAFTTFFLPGQTFNLLTRNCCGDIYSGHGVVNGVSYASFFYGGTIDFNSVIPPLNWAQGAFSIVVPFNITGTLQGCTQSAGGGLCTGGIIFDTLVTGQGMATVELFGIMIGDHRSFSVGRVTYNFGDPVPEPTTLLLLGTGLAGAAAAARRRRQAGR